MKTRTMKTRIEDRHEDRHRQLLLPQVLRRGLRGPADAKDHDDDGGLSRVRSGAGGRWGLAGVVFLSQHGGVVVPPAEGEPRRSRVGAGLRLGAPAWGSRMAPTVAPSKT